MPMYYAYYSASKNESFGHDQCRIIAEAVWKKLGLTIQPTAVDGASVWVADGKFNVVITARDLFSNKYRVSSHRYAVDFPEVAND